MKNIIFIFFVLVYSCNSGSNMNIIKEQKEYKISLNETIKNNNVPDFYKLSKNTQETYIGYFQGIEKNDSSAPYIFKDYFSDSLNFRITFCPKNNDKRLYDLEFINKAEENDYQQYSTFVFVYFFKKSTKILKYQDDPIKYPVKVTAYLRKNKSWQILNSYNAINLSELSEFELRTIVDNSFK